MKEGEKMATRVQLHGHFADCFAVYTLHSWKFSWNKIAQMVSQLRIETNGQVCCPVADGPSITTTNSSIWQWYPSGNYKKLTRASPAQQKESQNKHCWGFSSKQKHQGVSNRRRDSWDTPRKGEKNRQHKKVSLPHSFLVFSLPLLNAIQLYLSHARLW